MPLYIGDPYRMSLTPFNARTRLLASVALLSALAAGGVVRAADATADSASAAAAPTTVTEVYVTARKQKERLIDVPVAITALTPTAINRYGGIKDLKDVMDNVPNLSITNVASGGGGAVSIRGLGSLGSDTGIPNEVAFILDGVSANRSRSINLGLLDLESVEVLKGPQALYFGSNSPAGVVAMNSVDPGRTFTGYANLSYEFTTQTPNIDAAVTIPITDTLSVRLAGKADTVRGYIRNVAPPTPQLLDPAMQAIDSGDPGAQYRYVDGSHEEMGRVSVAWRPSDRFSALVKFSNFQYTGNDEGGATTIKCGPGVTTVTENNNFNPVGVPVPGGSCNPGATSTVGGLNPTVGSKFPFSNNGKLFTFTRNNLLSANLTYKLDNLTLNSVTGYYNMGEADFCNCAYSSLAYDMGAQTENYHQVSEELRATSTFTAPINAMLGFYFEHSTDNVNSGEFFFPVPPDTVTGQTNTLQGNYFTTDDTYSVFGQVNWKILSNLLLTGGARYTHEHKLDTEQNTYENNNIVPLFNAVLGFPFNPFLPVGTKIVAPTTDDNVSPEVTLSWHPQPNVNIYAAYKTGYKSGGTSNPTALSSSSTATSLSFKPETAKGGEIGMKGEWFHSALRGDIVVYDYEFSNLQVQGLTLVNGLPTYNVDNAAKARTLGFEAQGSYAFDEHLSVRGNVGYNDAKFLSYPQAPCFFALGAAVLAAAAHGMTIPGTSVVGGNCVRDESGLQLPRAPAWTAGAGFTYSHPLMNTALLLTLSADVIYTDSYNPSDQLVDVLRVPGYAKINAGIKLSDPDKGWEISLSGTNLTDHIVYNWAYDRSGVAGGGLYFGGNTPPREIILAFRYMF